MKNISTVILILTCFSLYSQIGINTTSPANLLEVNINPNGNELFSGLELTRNIGFLSIRNGTSFSGEFQPRISGAADSNNSPGLTIVGTPSLINSTSRGIVLRAGESASLNDGNILEIDNYSTTHLAIDNIGQLALGNTSPEAKLHITNGDIYIEDINKGIIMQSPNGQCWRFTADNTGRFTSTSITCP